MPSKYVPEYTAVAVIIERNSKNVNCKLCCSLGMAITSMYWNQLSLLFILKYILKKDVLFYLAIRKN